MYALCLLFCVLSYSQAYDNLAYLRPTWQSTSHDDTVDSDRAVDGSQLRRDYHGKQCSISAGKQRTATWWVNLTDIRSINNIVIYYRTDDKEWNEKNNYKRRFLGFHVYVSNTTNRSTGHRCFPDTNFTKATIPSVVNISCPVPGQYVIYYNERLSEVTYPKEYSKYAFTELCEVEVYGCPDPYSYGPDCSNSCPRSCSQYCHIESGICPQCKPGYKGKYCEFENFALNKDTYQLSTFNRSYTGSEKAVDGLKTVLTADGKQCSVSDNSQITASWRVNLGDVVSIRNVVIYYRTDGIDWNAANGYTARFLGFYVYISNTTDRRREDLCFHDTNNTRATIPAILNLSCPFLGQYVIYYNERIQNNNHPSDYSKYAFNDLCEVEVYGCSRRYGANCSIPCPSNCKQHCELRSGNCLQCKPGYKGEKCDQECDGGFYGTHCSEACGHCLNSAQCQPVNGTCLNGCAAGYEGKLCNKTCGFGYYGHNCTKKCSVTCKDGCSKTNGICKNGCRPGWKGGYCNKECDGGYFGPQCNISCGHCYNSVQCHNINGSCLNGCAAGYNGTLCVEKCLEGTYGINCNETCSLNCKWNKNCNGTTGVCENGCKAGWKGSHCNQECSGGFFGESCNTTCGHCLNSEQCHHVNGSCLNGCETGYRGDHCTEECTGGYFGPQCSTSCGHCYNSVQCHHINGSCLNGCAAGYKGTLCAEKCLEGTYGINCNETCSLNCKWNENCNGTTGVCEDGCKAGWKGSHCNQECDVVFFGENCNTTCGHCLSSEQCHHVNGSCFNACEEGYRGENCSEGCSKGHFGQNCQKKCHLSCQDGHCNPKNGSCILMSGYNSEVKKSSATGVIAGVIVAVIVVLIAAVVLFIVLKRFRKPKQGRKTSTLLQDTTKDSAFTNMYANGNALLELRKKENQMDNSNHKEAVIYDGHAEEEDLDATDDLYMNQPYQSNIPVNQLSAAITEKRKKENEGFRKEYANFPSGEQHKCDEGKRKENVPKNRFKTTFPYDHSRVILRTTDKQPSDYINANYIDGPNRKKEYIAAQGPKENTLGDFWSMIWQENISDIVMLTNLREGEKIKCTQYWPDQDKRVNYGVISVKWMEEREYAFYVIRKLQVINKEMNESRVLTHYHYTAWPDHGTPDPLCLIIFHNHVIRTKTNPHNAPTVVHCSAGVGRTGTYIAVDMLHQTGQKTGKVNVAECVRKMRESRMTMVQTYEQYITIFLTLYEDFKAPMKVESIEVFKEKYESAGKDTPVNQNAVRKELQLLQKIRPIYTNEDYKFARESCGHDYSSGILPLDKYSIHLTSHVPKRGNFINAISVPSFTRARGFIVTQYPSREDAIDLLRLLKDHECDTVICLDPLKEIQSSNEWLPSALSFKAVPPFTVHCQSCSQTDVISSTIRIIQNNKENEAHTVTIVEPKSKVKSTGNPLETTQLRKLVSTALNNETQNPILVMSRDGASLCGVFCAVHNVIEQIIIDECVDIFTAVRQIIIRRPEFCANTEEFELIYKAVYDHIQSTSENIYYNQ